MNLSEHFTLAEASASDYAARNGLDNTPPAAVVPKLAAVALHVLEPVRAAFGAFSPTSWYRSVELNAAIGGAINSQHVRGEAVDLKIPGVSTLDLAHWCEKNLGFDQLIAECWDGTNPATGWVHVSWTDKGRRGDVLQYVKGHYIRGLPT